METFLYGLHVCHATMQVVVKTLNGIIISLKIKRTDVVSRKYDPVLRMNIKET